MTVRSCWGRSFALLRLRLACAVGAAANVAEVFSQPPNSRLKYTMFDKKTAEDYSASDLCIDLGTEHSYSYVRGSRIVKLNLPLLAIIRPIIFSQKMVAAVGAEANRMLGPHRANISAIRPMKDGVYC